MTDQSHNEMSRFDKLESIASRLPYPGGFAFLDQRKEIIRGLYGSGFLDDLYAALRDNDMDAAHRVWDQLCPATPFRMTQDGDWVDVVFDLDGESRREGLKTTHLSKAGHLVSIAIYVARSLALIDKLGPLPKP